MINPWMIWNIFFFFQARVEQHPPWAPAQRYTYLDFLCQTRGGVSYTIFGAYPKYMLFETDEEGVSSRGGLPPLNYMKSSFEKQTINPDMPQSCFLYVYPNYYVFISRWSHLETIYLSNYPQDFTSKVKSWIIFRVQVEKVCAPHSASCRQTGVSKLWTENDCLEKSVPSCDHRITWRHSESWSLLPSYSYNFWNEYFVHFDRPLLLQASPLSSVPIMSNLNASLQNRTDTILSKKKKKNIRQLDQSRVN